ncbi:sulfotransferase [Haliea sp. E1-2-M8]|uniref:sulfotransferase family protein n=1 Tax=Haliea sp. E1-2-M8 TaxID=3064706 RepID=UPI0027275920|nr:sulfotransferase [Haliea sp. E1-2-M8]MDO8862438.1 sulfotransferase [Haliea sp. E1-2-M8]
MPTEPLSPEPLVDEPLTGEPLPAEPRAAAARRPNLFLVGAQKSATTTLAVMLASHPEVAMATPKEPGFLAFGEQGYTCRDGHGAATAASGWVLRSERDYLALWQGAPARARVLGEASTWYLSEPGCAEKLQAFNSDARIVMLLRQPADRAYSAWCHALRDKEEPCARFEDALAAEAERVQPSHLLRYRELGHYARYLRRYRQVFGPERVLVLFYEDLLHQPETLWRQCCEFLQISHTQAPAAHRQNRSGMPRSQLLHKLLRSERFKRRVKQLLPLSFVARVKGQLDAVNLAWLPPIPPETRRQLTREFAAEIRELERLTGRDLQHWLGDA